jgi:hypothetical protein
MPTEIIIRDGVVASLPYSPPYVFDASRNADVTDNYTWADINLTGIYTMDTRYKTTDTNIIYFSRNEIWARANFFNIRYTGPSDAYYSGVQSYPPNTIIAQVIPSLTANTQYSLIQSCNTIRNTNIVTGNTIVKRYATNDISWVSYSMTMRKGTGTNVIIDCRSGRRYITVTITNFDFSVTHVFATDGNRFYLDGTVIATVLKIEQYRDGFTDVNAPNVNPLIPGDLEPYTSSALFGGDKGYKFTTNFDGVIFSNVYAILGYGLQNPPDIVELQNLACYRYGATLIEPVFTATASATLTTSQVVVFNNATFSGTIQII